MKLNTLLLTSAATLMATSVAFAADLPSKKAAPAAGSVQVCKVGGMTGMTLPGSDTCLGVSGWVRFDGTYVVDGGENDADIPDNESDDGELDWSAWGGTARLNLDARSNTEIGMVRSFIGLEGGNGGIVADRAFVQFAGITAGRKDSIASVLGTQSDSFSLSDREEEGIDYQVKVGGLNLGLGLEAPNNNNDDGESADNPDVVAHLSGSVGTVNFAVAGVSHQAIDWAGDTTNGHAFLGNINTTVNGLRLGIFGATASNASAYTGGAWSLGVNADDTDGDVMYDFDEGQDLDSHMYGATATYTMGKLTLGVEYARYEASQTDDDDRDTDIVAIDTDTYAVFAGYQAAKGLTLYTEFYSRHNDIEFGNDQADADDSSFGDQNSQTILFRIQRDF